MPSAQQVTWAHIRVFTVALAAISIFLVLAYLLTGGTLFQPKANLYLYVPDATGLGKSSPVRVNGIDVGQVSAVSFSGSNEPNRVVRLKLDVEAQYLPSIPADSFAQISSDTAVGDMYVDVTRGKSTMHIEPNGDITYKPQPELLKTLDIEQFTKQLRNVDELLTMIEQGQGPVGEFIKTDALYNQLLKQIAAVDDQIQKMASPSNPMGKLLFTDQVYQQIKAPLDRIDRSLTAISSGQGTLGQLIRSDANYTQLAGQLGYFRKSIESIRSSPFFQNDEVYRNLSSGLASVIQNVDQFNLNPLLNNSATYDNLVGMADQMRNTAHDFLENPKKYLRIKVF